jgi:hypothetical protein|nr:MAG TPA: major capsid protein [Caudoviricetes sp.]
MPNWNGINLERIFDDPSVKKQVEVKIETGYWKESKLDFFMGKGKNRAIRVYPTNTLDPYIPRLKDKLRGDGVTGNTDFNANLDEFEVFSNTVYPKVVGNSVKSEIAQYTRLKNIDFVAESIDGLKDWMKDRVQAHTFASLVNNFTNVVVAKNGGFYDTTSAADVRAACANIVAGDTLNVKAVRRLVSMAKNGYRYNGESTFAISPLRVEMKTEKGITFIHETYVLFVDSYQAEQLKNDPEWGEMQKQAGERGKNNNIFTGIVGTIDNCAVVDMGNWNECNVGLPTSHFSQDKFSAFVSNAEAMTLGDYSGKSDRETSIGALLGASAICNVMNDTPKIYIDEAQDLGRKTQVGIDKVIGIAKAVFNSHKKNSQSAYNGQDFGVIGIISSKE